MATRPKCPICGRPAADAHKPFCTARCRQVDLGRWLGEVYRVPVVEEDDDEMPSSRDRED